MRQIPLNLLPHTAVVRVPDAEAAYGGEFAEPVTIEHVRFDRAARLAPTEFSLAEGATGRIYVDAVNSAGAFRIPVGSEVTVDGETVEVIQCTQLDGFNGRVHHWEVDVA